MSFKDVLSLRDDDIANFITDASKLWSATAALLSNLNSTKLLLYRLFVK